jgi:anti-sigma factor RsiW
MTEAYAILDAHAYVDNCLSPADRLTFEAAMRRDAKLRARVEAWSAQNDALRLAFGSASRPRANAAPALGRPSNENNAAPSPAPSRAPARAQPLRERGAAGSASRGAAARLRSCALALLVFAAGLVAFAGGPDDPRVALMARAAPVLRAATAYADTRLDFISDDPRAISAWLAPRFARLDAKRLAPPGWSLLGVRIVAGVDSAAALVLYEDALGGKAGLLLEPTDALPDLAGIGGSDADMTVIAGAANGFAYAAVGPNRSGVGALVPVPRED